MTKYELLEFLEPFDSEIEIDIVPVYTICNGEGAIGNKSEELEDLKTKLSDFKAIVR